MEAPAHAHARTVGKGLVPASGTAAEPVETFAQVDGDAAFGQRDRGGQPGDAAPGDDDARAPVQQARVGQPGGRRVAYPPPVARGGARRAWPVVGGGVRLP